MSEQTIPSKTTSSKKLEGKDLINIGIYGAIYCVLMTAMAMIGFIPVLMPLVCVLIPLVCGIPMVLFMTKIKKPGMLLIMSLILGIYLAVTGMGFWVILIAAITGFLSELVLKSGNYQSSSKLILAHGVFCMFIWGNFLPMFIDSGYYTNLLAGGYTQEYVEVLMGIFPMWSAPIYLVACFVFGIIGGFTGKAILKKHFAKAGIA